MPGTNDIEENKIFEEIARGGAGKGKNAGKYINWRNYRQSPLWDNLEKKKRRKEGENTVDK